MDALRRSKIGQARAAGDPRVKPEDDDEPVGDDDEPVEDDGENRPENDGEIGGFIVAVSEAKPRSWRG
jgi:hypothetical protein